MKRKTLVALEIICLIFLVLAIFLLILNLFPIFLESLTEKLVLNLDNSNKHIIESYLKESEYYKPKQSIKNAEKIQYFLNFNDAEYTIYYDDGTEYKVGDDDISILREYIRTNGYPAIYKNIAVQIFLIVIFVVVFFIKKKISIKIDSIDR